MKKFTCIGCCLIFLFFIGGCTCFMAFYNENHPSGMNKYYNLIEPTGILESKYMQLGSHNVKTYEEDAEGTLLKYKVWYPEDMINQNTTFPVIISNNGTGWGVSKYPEWFNHMASWGFIVVGNEEGTSWNGNSAEESLNWILRQDSLANSIFYNHINKEKIGTIGHSQGGTGVVNSITVQPSAKMYKTAVMLASTFDGYSSFLRWESDASKIKVPTLILVAKDDGLTPPKDLYNLYNAIPNNVFKVMGRRLNVGHGDMLVFADGYVTAWMLWQLQDNDDAGKAFIGKSPELSKNKDFIEVRTSETAITHLKMRYPREGI
ncbi:MAG: hypothetical protein Q4F97_08400 [Bacteroidales bacterium]|nr:hypothetical protein [Bacteroidales bacterium]